ncbi:hypothetical protein M0804_011990 [Polistes exclamans]|nr:hypothetical protein M0804_011990 [Polistes exclamans]
MADNTNENVSAVKEEVENANENDDNNKEGNVEGGEVKSRSKRNIITVPQFDIINGENTYRLDSSGVMRQVVD